MSDALPKLSATCNLARVPPDEYLRFARCDNCRRHWVDDVPLDVGTLYCPTCGDFAIRRHDLVISRHGPPGELL